jgi:hypothetical protein
MYFSYLADRYKKL